MFAHWLARPDGGGNYGHGIRIARRGPGPQGRWDLVASFNEKDPVDYAGFLSFSGHRAAYLSPPAVKHAAAPPDKAADEAHVKTLRLALFDADGRVLSDTEMDGDVCSCCQTATAETPSGLLIAYRDHLAGEIRDISLIRIKHGKASPSTVLHRDGWHINGCPTEGPTIATLGQNAGIAWMTRASGISRLQLALSQDGGSQFRAPIRVDDGNPLGRPHLTQLNAAEFLLVWLERSSTNAEIRVRRVGADG